MTRGPARCPRRRAALAVALAGLVVATLLAGCGGAARVELRLAAWEERGQYGSLSCTPGPLHVFTLEVVNRAEAAVSLHKDAWQVVWDGRHPERLLYRSGAETAAAQAVSETELVACSPERGLQPERVLLYEAPVYGVTNGTGVRLVAQLAL